LESRTAEAHEYLRLSGYADFEKPITLTTPFAEDPLVGHTFSPKRISEIVPGKVYALSGYEFYARENYQKELSIALNAPGPMGQRFFGNRFSLEDVRSFKVDITIDSQTEVKIGGTRIEFIPVQGGETQDGLIIHLPDHGVMFVGDFIMPYLGAPFVEEGNLEGLLDAIDIVVQKNPRHLLHGHEPLTRLFASPSILATLKTYLAWLHEEVQAAIRRGDERASIQQANLIPPGLLGGDPDSHLPYLVMRENVINRTYDQNVGY